MIRLRCLGPFLLSAFGLVACGGQASRDGTASPDGGPADATPGVDVVSSPDAPTAEFCAGSSKAEHGGALASPAAVTSALVLMDCCDAFSLRFHTENQLGFGVSLMVQQFGGVLGGTFELPSDGGGLAVFANESDAAPGQDAVVSGSLRIDAPGTYDQPSYATACLSISAAGQKLDGTRLYASNVVVAPYTWASRLELRLLDDPAVTAEQAAKLPLDSLPIAKGQALVDLMSLKWYDGTSHTLTWDGWHSSKLLLGQLPPVGVYGLPFVVIADGKPEYLGAFMTAMSSMAVSMPVIVIENMKDESFQIEGGYPSGAPPAQDARNDPQVLGVLQSAGKLVQ